MYWRQVGWHESIDSLLICTVPVNPVLDAADVTRLALEKNDELAVLAVQQFLSILGSVSGEIALTQGARGGVYFCGGVLPRIASLLACERSDGALYR